MKIGIIIELNHDTDIKEKFAQAKKIGIDNCQLTCWDMTALTSEKAAEIMAAVKSENFEITAFWCGWNGPKVWNFYEGPVTLGLVPPEYRFQRMQILEKGSDFAKAIHVSDVVTHVGFLPESPYDPNYQPLLVSIKSIVEKCKENGQRFLFETGQETPITLLRVIQDLNCDNVGINLDPANLLLYGKANPIDSLEIYGKYVHGVHGKDGLYPTDGHNLGKEMPIGKGKVNFPLFIKKLKECGYDGSITIEREITGKQQQDDIVAGKKFLETYI
jgi:sugar phosphate isomerase/epimerase